MIREFPKILKFNDSRDSKIREILTLQVKSSNEESSNKELSNLKNYRIKNHRISRIIELK
jgi:hypothetical protein